jgi:transcription-repair coupling factor (superfamily II helicase)
MPRVPGIDQVWEAVNGRYRSLGSDITRPLLAPAEVFLPPDELRAALKRHTRIEFTALEQPERAGAHNFGAGELALAREAGKRDDPVARIAAIAALPQARRKLFCAETPGRREMLVELLARAGVKAQAVAGWEDFLRGEAPCAITIAPIAESFRLDEPSCLVVAESALFGKRVMQRRRRSRAAESAETSIRNLAELAIGAPVVHVDHGVGRYVGLTRMTIGDTAGEFVTIEYAGGDRLHVPVSSLDLVSRYSGAIPELAPLHRLGTDQWLKARRRAAEKIRDVAAELLDLYSRRAARPGRSASVDAASYEAFAGGFPFALTDDQAKAIDDVLADLASPRPMDRLVCGDVGFGKTEVALRAAFARRGQRQAGGGAGADHAAGPAAP